MWSIVFSAYISLVLIQGLAAAQPTQDHPHADSAQPLSGCDDAPTGRRPAGANCAVLARKQFTTLPEGPLGLRFENFSTTEAAQHAATAASAVVEAAGKVWLLTLGSRGQRSQAGTFVAEVGPVPAVPPAASYVLEVAEAEFGPDQRAAVARAVHTHPGPEIFYLLTGEQCLETPDGTTRARAGEGMLAPANTPMQLNITGSLKRDAFFVVIHDAAKPRVTPSSWQPKGTCQSSDSKGLP